MFRRRHSLRCQTWTSLANHARTAARSNAISSRFSIGRLGAPAGTRPGRRAACALGVCGGGQHPADIHSARLAGARQQRPAWPAPAIGYARDPALIVGSRPDRTRGIQPAAGDLAKARARRPRPAGSPTRTSLFRLSPETRDATQTTTAASGHRRPIPEILETYPT